MILERNIHYRKKDVKRKKEKYINIKEERPKAGQRIRQTNEIERQIG